MLRHGGGDFINSAVHDVAPASHRGEGPDCLSEKRIDGFKGILNAGGRIRHGGHAVIFKTNHEVRMFPQCVERLQGLFPAATAFEGKRKGGEYGDMSPLGAGELCDARGGTRTGSAPETG
jgi:hypothetical protein